MPSPAPSSPAPLLAPPPAARRGRRRRLLPSPATAAPASASASSSSPSSSSGASSSSSGLSFSFPPFSPAPSPFHHRCFLSPLRASAVPFSWEHRPGIPKTPARQARGGGGGGKPGAAKGTPLPLPPSLASSKVGAGDGFLVVSGSARKGRRRRRQPALAAALADWLAVLSLYRSCTRSRECLASTPPPRPRAPAKKAG